MRDSYDINIQLKCITCGETTFDFNDDKTWVKCKHCGKEYLGGYDELVEANYENINEGLKENRDKIYGEIKSDITEMLKETFKSNKKIKF